VPVFPERKRIERASLCRSFLRITGNTTPREAGWAWYTYYTPREAGWAWYTYYTHPGRHGGGVYLLYTPREAWWWVYTLLHPGRHGGSIYPITPREAWWVVYTPVYATLCTLGSVHLYIPPYLPTLGTPYGTPYHARTGVRCMQGSPVCLSEALGSKRRLVRDMRRIEGLLLPKVWQLRGDCAQSYSALPDERLDKIG